MIKQFKILSIPAQGSAARRQLAEWSQMDFYT